jgi:SAM-dependent methyltransferase
MKEKIKRFLNKLDKYEPRRRFFYSLSPSAKVLDVGCGNGLNGMLLKTIHANIEIYGVDLLPREKVPEIYSYSVIDLDNGRLPYPDNFFDAIIFTHVIEHLKLPWPLGKEFSRVMKSKGKIYIETPNWTTVFVPSFGFHREQQNPFNFYDDASHFKPWTKHGLFNFLLQSCSFRVEKVGTVRNWFKVPFDFILMLFGFLRGKRLYIIRSFWNLFGWCIYGYGVKE